MKPVTYAELEISLHLVTAERYEVELRFSDPTSEAELPPERGTADLDLAELLTLRGDTEAYGKALANALFHDDNVGDLYTRARATAAASGSFLRLSLLVGPTAPELQALRWELLRDPESGAPLATSERTLFSRFMLSRDYRPVKLRPKTSLKALVAVAAPSDLAEYKLSDVDVEGEVSRASTSLEDIDVAVAGRDEPLTLDRLVAGLRPGVDILYLVCHGVLTRRQVPYLLLQDDEGKVARVEGAILAQAVSELQRPPRLVVLASCESAGTEQGTTAEGRATAEASLAPRLAEAGVPAVLAMQGKVSVETIHEAMPIFFSELLKDGQIDRALAVARGHVRDRHDFWMPALYLRLKRGLIWYVPGFGGDDFSKWRSITASVRRGRFIPIVGPDVAEHVFGPSEDLPRRLSEKYGFPLAAHHSTDLTKIAQYLSVSESPRYARDRIVKQLRKQLLELHPELEGPEKLPLPKLIDELVAKADESEAFRILAELPAKVYVTSCADLLLLKSLRAARRNPTPLLCEWRPSAESHPQEPPYDADPTYGEPVVYHAFGAFGIPSSLVLTEDDFFDYLIATAQYSLMPTVVRGALTSGSLLFLGFRFDDWTFRILFRLIMALGGSQRLREFTHVGVQVDPEDADPGDVEEARRYLERYYSGSGDMPPVSIYWGDAADFLRELRDQMDQVDEESVFMDSFEGIDDWLA